MSDDMKVVWIAVGLSVVAVAAWWFGYFPALNEALFFLAPHA